MKAVKALIPCLALALLSITGCNTTASIAQRAANGDVQAQFEYGRRLLTGKGVGMDAARALVWFHIAAELDYPPAMHAIAYCHEKGLGTPVSKKKAREWYKRAADAGSTASAFTLVGIDFRDGREQQAVERLDALSKARNGTATHFLIKRYMNPDSPAYNPRKGIDYIRYAALDGSMEAARALAYCYNHGLGVPKNPTLAKGWLEWNPKDIALTEKFR